MRYEWTAYDHCSVKDFDGRSHEVWLRVKKKKGEDCVEVSTIQFSEWLQ